MDGVSKTAFLTLNYLRQTGREVMVFAPDIAPNHIGDTRIVPLFSFGFPGVPETRVALPNPTIAREIEDFQPDLIQLFSPGLMAVSGMAVGRHLNVPVIANYQTDLPGYAKQYGMSFASNLVRNWLRYVHNGCHLTLVPSQSTTDELKANGYKRLRFWARGVDSGRFDSAHRSDAWREKLLNGRDPNALLCVYVGRLATEKRIDLLLDVARLPGVALTIIGDGAQREELETLFAGTDTHFTGYLFGEDLPRAFASADAFVFTGPNETFGQVVQEAMASGLACVVTEKGAVGDLVEEGRTGFVCDDTPEAFAQAVAYLRDMPDVRRMMGYRARKIAAGRSWEAVMSQLEDHYKEALHMNSRFKRIFQTTNYHKIYNLPGRVLIG